MRVPSPNVSQRLLPLLDIVFILLAFFIILPQGVPERAHIRAQERMHRPAKEELIPQRFVYFLVEGNTVKMSYYRRRGYRLVKEFRRFSLEEFLGVEGGVPGRMKRILGAIRAQLKRRDSSLDIMMVIQGTREGSVIIQLKLVGFAVSNGLEYGVFEANPMEGV